MFFLRFLRMVITVLLVILLLMTGFFALFVYSIDKSVFTTDYFSEDLLYSGTYSSFYNYFVDKYVSTGLETEDSGEIAAINLADRVIRSVDPMVVPNAAATYLSDWIEYLLAEVPENEIPVLDVEELQSSIYDAAIAIADDEDFLLMLLRETLEEQGYNMDDYSYEEQLAMIEDFQVKELYISTVDEQINGESSLFNLTEIQQNPLAVLSYVAPELSEEELSAKVHSNYGILEYYKSIANIVYAALLAGLGIIFILWLSRLNVGFLINGIVIIFSAAPLLIISRSEKVFDFIVNSIASYTFDFDYVIENIDFFNNAAVKPITEQMLITSGIAIAIGILFVIVSILLPKKESY